MYKVCHTELVLLFTLLLCASKLVVTVFIERLNQSKHFLILKLDRGQ